jgi:hypothetical protein
MNNSVELTQIYNPHVLGAMGALTLALIVCVILMIILNLPRDKNGKIKKQYPTNHDNYPPNGGIF